MKLWQRWICRLGIGLTLATTGGCNIVGAVAAKTMGPPKVPAEYDPPKDQPLVVVVENYHDASLQQPSDQLAMLVTRKLTDQKIAPIIPNDKLVALRTEQGAAYDKMKIPEVGRAVGARQVVYVNLRQCSIEGILGGDDLRCNVDAVVKVVDVDTGQTKWPGVGDGREIPIHTDYSRSQGRKTAETVRDTVLDDLADGIATLFYKHQPESEIPKD